MNRRSSPTFRLLPAKRIQLQIVKATILRFILTDQLCNSTLFFSLGKEEMLILSENVLLLLGTKNMHLLKKCAPGDWNTHLPLLLLLPDTTVTCFCCRNYQAKAKSIKTEQHFAAEGLTRKDKLLTGVLLLVY